MRTISTTILSRLLFHIPSMSVRRLACIDCDDIAQNLRDHLKGVPVPDSKDNLGISDFLEEGKVEDPNNEYFNVILRFYNMYRDLTGLRRQVLSLVELQEHCQKVLTNRKIHKVSKPLGFKNLVYLNE
jgi:hypothetical protein